MFPSVETYVENSLININREKYNISANDKLFIIGNPPYNDVTSQYKKGQKGSFDIDYSVKSRDLGISFLKMYALLDADYICVLHPLSYLIKKANFSALSFFKNEYVLEKGMIFSSKHFESIKRTNIEFPVVLALYKKEFGGMRDYNFIRSFKFEILNSTKTFRLKDFITIDGIINKYPTKNTCINDLQFYTIRDINALRRNTSFINGNSNNSIKVSINDLYKYAWIDYFKAHFNPKYYFLYGNLSPFYHNDIELPDTKRELISYIISTNRIVSNYYVNQLPLLYSHYQMSQIKEQYPNLSRIMKEILEKIE